MKGEWNNIETALHYEGFIDMTTVISKYDSTVTIRVMGPSKDSETLIKYERQNQPSPHIFSPFTLHFQKVAHHL